MEIQFECGSCKFNLSLLPIEVKIGLDLKDGSPVLACPLCGEQVILDLKALRIFYRETGSLKSHVLWKSKSGIEPSRPGEGATIQVGRLRLVFELLAVLEPKDICHRAVPLFWTEDGKIIHPLLPVRREYFDCLDEALLKRMVESGAEVSGIRGGRYYCNLPLRGVSGGGIESIAGIPILSMKPGSSARTIEGEALRGVNLRVWPNVDFREWRHYIVGLSAVSPEGKEVLKGAQPLRAWCRAPGSLKWVPLDVETRGGEAFACAVDGRPEWVEVEIASMGAESTPSGGGIFRVPPVVKSVAGENWLLSMAIDFGTSNTCIAFVDGEGQERLVPALSETDLNLYVFRAGPEPTTHPGPDLWPPSAWFGKAEDLLPSEILFSKPKDQMAAGLKSIDLWRFGIEYGIPGAGIIPNYPEEDYVLGEFKWRYMVEASSPIFVQHLVQLQARYLEAALMSALVRILRATKLLPSSIDVRWSFPIAFNKDDLADLEAAFEEASKRLFEITGIKWACRVGPNESRAAALVGGMTQADLVAYLDMGGGSTEIAIENPRYPPHEPRPIFMTSIRYAGTHLLESFGGDGTPGSSCLVPAAGVKKLRRSIRESNRPRDLLAREDLFNRRFSEVLKNRTRHFYLYIAEYVARMIAAAIIERKAFRDDRLSRRLRVALYLFGNGWGFGTVFDDDIHHLFRTILTRRVKKILDEEIQADKEGSEGLKPKEVEVEFEPDIDVLRLKGIPRGHVKAVVAFGLLKREADDTRDETRGRVGILGYTTTVNGNRKVPWFRFTGRGCPVGESGIDGRATLNWEDCEPPGFDTGIATPSELDRGFNYTRAALLRECRAKLDDFHWFVNSPFEVMLVELFRKKLGRIGGGSYGG